MGILYVQCRQEVLILSLWGVMCKITSATGSIYQDQHKCMDEMENERKRLNDPITTERVRFKWFKMNKN